MTKQHAARVGLAEFEVRPEFGVYRLYVSGYGRPETPVATIESEVAASVILDLLRRGSEDVRNVPVTPIDDRSVGLAGPVDSGGD